MDPLVPIDKFEVFATGLDHPECLAFDRHGQLWAGGEAGQIYRIDPKGEVTTVAELGSFNAGLAFSPSGDLFVCNPNMGIVRIAPSGSDSVFATRAAAHKLVTPNFPVFDRAGNMYVSDSGKWKQQDGCLLRFTPDGLGQVIGGPFGYANGLALSADEKHLFMVESNMDRVYRFQLHADGALGAAEIYAEGIGRLPDGLALDAAGNLYVSCYASDEIYRISPSGEKSLLSHDRWAILLSRPTNVAFGGENFDELYVANLGRYTITRAKIGARGQRLAHQQ